MEEPSDSKLVRLFKRHPRAVRVSIYVLATSGFFLFAVQSAQAVQESGLVGAITSILVLVIAIMVAIPKQRKYRAMADDARSDGT